MKIEPYLLFNGNCREAFTTYAKVIGGKIRTMMTFSGSPAETSTPPEWRDKILHADIELLDRQVLLGSDAPPGHFHKPQGFSVSLSVDSTAEVERIYKALSEGGTVTMPLGKTFFAESFAMLTDRFGIPWILIYGTPETPVR